jgi:hypothetical protein
MQFLGIEPGPWCILVAGAGLLFARDRVVRFSGAFLILAGLALANSYWLTVGVAAVAVGLVFLLLLTRLFPRSQAPIIAAEPPPNENLASTEPIRCLQCGELISSGAAKCSNCGWTYRTE